MSRFWLACLIGFAALSGAAAARAGRLEQVKARGVLECGVFPHIAGFATIGPDGRYSGFDIDICRAVATAIFGTPDRVKFVETTEVAAFKRRPDLDLVVRRLTWTLTRESSLGLMFGPIMYYDGQGFLVPAASGIADAKQLAGKRICVEPGEGWAGNLARYGRAHDLALELVVAEQAESMKNFFDRRCDAYSADKTMLGDIRTKAVRPRDYAILPDEISKEPLAPLVRQGDDRFFQVVRWSMFALIDAEELGLKSGNIEKSLTSENPDIKAFLGIVPGNGKALGLSEHWSADIIRAVGNYGEIFDRNLGDGSAIGLNRGLNRLWTDGGLIYAPPVR